MDALFVINPAFRTGSIVATRGVYDLACENSDFAQFVQKSLNRHVKGDWGDLGEEDKQENDLARQNGGLRLFSSYEHPTLPKIWIITEADRSATTILFPDEY